jgi:hypothetical protein
VNIPKHRKSALLNIACFSLINLDISLSDYLQQLPVHQLELVTVDFFNPLESRDLVFDLET